MVTKKIFDLIECCVLRLIFRLLSIGGVNYGANPRPQGEPIGATGKCLPDPFIYI